MRVAFVLRSAEVQPLFRRFVQDLFVWKQFAVDNNASLVISPPPPKQNIVNTKETANI